MDEKDRKFWMAGWWDKSEGRRSRETLMALFGLGANATLPAGGMPEAQYRGVRVRIAPIGETRERAAQEGRRMAGKPHRILATCPDCGMEVSAGRLHQHLGTAFCRMGRQ